MNVKDFNQITKVLLPEQMSGYAISNSDGFIVTNWQGNYLLKIYYINRSHNENGTVSFVPYIAVSMECDTDRKPDFKQGYDEYIRCCPENRGFSVTLDENQALDFDKALEFSEAKEFLKEHETLDGIAVYSNGYTTITNLKNGKN